MTLSTNQLTNPSLILPVENVCLHGADRAAIHAHSSFLSHANQLELHGALLSASLQQLPLATAACGRLYFFLVIVQFIAVQESMRTREKRSIEIQVKHKQWLVILLLKIGQNSCNDQNQLSEYTSSASSSELSQLMVKHLELPTSLQISFIMSHVCSYTYQNGMMGGYHITYLTSGQIMCNRYTVHPIFHHGCFLLHTHR